ncbi:MAG: GTP cyclohydrolase I FolE [Endomicrobium sp.]|uniref:GTP cyclohydrolase I FolE n=1 Tax=Candidatus Endomicrobiellum cubanum TaxID=3242325 RepID=UPI002817CB61|nr:GTP cyclohydrolase I FolE [Endomicrobium sp.]
MKKFNFDEIKAKEAIKLLLESFGEDLNRDGIKRTPERVVEFYKEVLSGNSIDSLDLVPISYSSEEHEEIVLIKDVSFYSLCEHHLLPFFGKVHMAYIPQKDKIVGISKLIGLIEIFANRLQLQERFTKQISDTVMQLLKPHGVMVIVEAEHLCMTMRGIKKTGSLVITQSVRGKFSEDEKARKEAMSLLGK